MIFRAATFNVNSITARLPIVEGYLRSDGAPALICFQETKCVDAKFPADELRELGYECAYRGMKSYNGVAIASRLQLSGVSHGFGSGRAAGEQDEARLISADAEGIRVICAYVPQGKEMGTPDFAYKLRFLELLAEEVSSLIAAGREVLLMGDMNVAPTDIDVTNPSNKRQHVCCCEDARRAFAALAAAGLRDVWRAHRPGEGEFSFWDYRVPRALERNIGWRIDHVLATPALADASRGITVARELRAMERPSDHTAVCAEFELGDR